MFDCKRRRNSVLAQRDHDIHALVVTPFQVRLEPDHRLVELVRAAVLCCSSLIGELGSGFAGPQSRTFSFSEAVACRVCSVEHARLVGGDHILDVDEGIFATVSLKEFEGLLDQVAEIESLALAVVNLVAEVGVVLLEEVHHWKNLAVVGDEGLTDGVGASDESLQDLEGDGNNFTVAGVESG